MAASASASASASALASEEELSQIIKDPEPLNDQPAKPIMLYEALRVADMVAAAKAVINEALRVADKVAAAKAVIAAKKNTDESIETLRNMVEIGESDNIINASNNAAHALDELTNAVEEFTKVVYATETVTAERRRVLSRSHTLKFAKNRGEYLRFLDEMSNYPFGDGATLVSRADSIFDDIARNIFKHKGKDYFCFFDSSVISYSDDDIKSSEGNIKKELLGYYNSKSKSPDEQKKFLENCYLNNLALELKSCGMDLNFISATYKQLSTQDIDLFSIRSMNGEQLKKQFDSTSCVFGSTSKMFGYPICFDGRSLTWKGLERHEKSVKGKGAGLLCLNEIDYEKIKEETIAKYKMERAEDSVKINGNYILVSDLDILEVDPEHGQFCIPFNDLEKDRLDKLEEIQGELETCGIGKFKELYESLPERFVKGSKWEEVNSLAKKDVPDEVKFKEALSELIFEVRGKNYDRFGDEEFSNKDNPNVIAKIMRLGGEPVKSLDELLKLKAEGENLTYHLPASDADLHTVSSGDRSPDSLTVTPLSSPHGMPGMGYADATVQIQDVSRSVAKEMGGLMGSSGSRSSVTKVEGGEELCSEFRHQAECCNIDFPQPIGKVVWIVKGNEEGCPPQLKVTHDDQEYFEFVKELITIHHKKVPINKFHFDGNLNPRLNRDKFNELIELGAHDVAADFEKRLLMELMKIFNIIESAGPQEPLDLKEIGDRLIFTANMSEEDVKSYLNNKVRAHCEKPGGYQKERLIKLMKSMEIAEEHIESKVDELLYNLQRPYEPPSLDTSSKHRGLRRFIKRLCCTGVFRTATATPTPTPTR